MRSSTPACPAALWAVVTGEGSVIGNAVVDAGDYVVFTGSTATGRRVAERAAARLVGSSMELGGKNAVIVLDDVDPVKAAADVANACFTASGQLCVSMERVYVMKGVADAFIPAFAERVKAMVIGPAFDYSTDFGSLATAQQLENVMAHIDDATKKGATILAGGKARPDIGPYFIEPTVLTDVTADMKCASAETFGPVVAVHVVDSEDAAVRESNDSEYGLNGAVFSRSRSRARRVAVRLNAGTVNVNEGYRASFGSMDAPMGGVEQSGLGRRNGPEGLLRFVEAHTVADNTGLLQLPTDGTRVVEDGQPDDAAAAHREGDPPPLGVARGRLGRLGVEGRGTRLAELALSLVVCRLDVRLLRGDRLRRAGATSSTSASRMMRRGSYWRGSSFFQSTSSNSGPISSRMRSFAPSAIPRRDFTSRASWAA